MTNSIKILRVYDLTPSTEGYRMLIDRVWPKGFRKKTLRLDSWAKEIAPSPELMGWFDYAPEKFDMFESLYRTELDMNTKADSFAHEVLQRLEIQDVVLLCTAKNLTYTHAVILLGWLMDQQRKVANIETKN